MPSSLIVPVATIDALLPHTNADSLELAHVLGWQIVVRKGQFEVGDKIVYIPPDSVLPLELSDHLGVTRYLSNQRVRCARLRGESSFGLVMRPDRDWDIGENVADYYGITKYERFLDATDALPSPPLFQKYTTIENLRNYPDVFFSDEIVVVTEKIHGTSARIGMIDGEVMVGSFELRRDTSSRYWYPATLPPVKQTIEKLGAQYRQVIFYGEVYGPKVQKLGYGLKGQQLGFRIFDILIDGRFLDHEQLVDVCDHYGLDRVPVLGVGRFNMDTIKYLAVGPTTLGSAHIREGVVVRPLCERTDPRIGRVILKYVSDAYLLKQYDDVTDR